MNTHGARLVLRSVLWTSAVVCAGCASKTPAGPQATYTGQVNLELGDGLADSARGQGGRVSGLAFDSTGRMFVADAATSTLLVYETSGRLALSVRPETSRVAWCCLGVHDDLVWLFDRRTNNYRGYSVGAHRVALRERLVLPTPATWLSNRVAFDTLNRLIHVADAAGPVAPTTRMVRHFVARAGGAAVVDTVPTVVSDELGRSQLVVRRGGGSSVFQQPFGPGPLYALGPHGEYAFAVSSKYEVFIWGADLRTRRVLVGDAQAPELSRAERRQAQRVLSSIAQRQHVAVGALPFGVPEHRAVLEQLTFDLDGRLWVVRTVPAGEPHLADVYGAGGQLVGRMTWPANISLALGAIRDNVALGTTAVGRGERVVRLTFTHRDTVSRELANRISGPRDGVARARSRS